ncbi:hypothetical protein [Hylemonella gracilis]|nr:hypothetical protein [Hylemonella gracilis]
MQRLRVIVWSHHVMVASGAVQADQFERLISKSHPKLRFSSGLWPRYLRGDVMPQGAQEQAKSSLILRLDRIYPGTAEIFYHPIWELMDFDRLLGPQRLRELYLSMAPSIWSPFVDSSSDGDLARLHADEEPFWKVHHKAEELDRLWSRVTGLDGVAVCLIEARMSYLGQTGMRFVHAMLGARTRLLSFGKDAGFQFPKQQSILVLLEAMCLRLIECLVVDRSGLAKNNDIARAIRHWQASAERRMNSHLESLPRPDRLALQMWSAQVTRQDYSW